MCHLKGQQVCDKTVSSTGFFFPLFTSSLFFMPFIFSFLIFLQHKLLISIHPLLLSLYFIPPPILCHPYHHHILFPFSWFSLFFSFFIYFPSLLYLFLPFICTLFFFVCVLLIPSPSPYVIFAFVITINHLLLEDTYCSSSKRTNSQKHWLKNFVIDFE